MQHYSIEQELLDRAIQMELCQEELLLINHYLKNSEFEYATLYMDSFQNYVKNKTSIEDILSEILNHQIANRGSEHAFYRCYTYKYGDFPEWVLKAEHMLSELIKLKDQPHDEN